LSYYALLFPFPVNSYIIPYVSRLVKRVVRGDVSTAVTHCAVFLRVVGGCMRKSVWGVSLCRGWWWFVRC